MAKKQRKTRSEKVKSTYRLENFKLSGEIQAREKRKETQEFGYLSKEFISKDLTRTVAFSIVIIAIEILISWYPSLI